MAARSRSSWPTRLIWLLLIIAALYTAVWFAGAYVIEQRLAGSDHPVVQGCEDRDITGFPLSMAVTCTRYDLGGAVETGGAKLSAPITDLGRVRLEITAPATITPPNRTDGGVVEASWAALSTEGEVGVLSRKAQDLSLSARDLLVRAGPHDLTIDALDALMSEGAAYGGVAEDAVLRADATAIQAKLPYGLSLAPADLTLRATIRDGMARLARNGYRLRDVLARGADADVQQLALNLPDGGRLVLSGPLTLAADGLLSGKVRVGVADGQALTAFVSTLGPQAQQVVAGLTQAIAAAGQPVTVDGETLRTIEVTLDRSNVRLGFFNLGRIPPLRF